MLKARHISTDRIVAIKFLQPYLVTDSARKERMKREARLLAALDHPNILTVLGASFDDGEPFIVTEFVEGVTLSDLLKGCPVIPVERFYRLFRQILEGLQAAHNSNIVHRDLKPGNIMVSNQDGQEAIKILDFDIAKRYLDTSEQDLTQTGHIIGSPMYMSPEQCSASSVDQRTDIYAAGCIAYECLSGSVPFDVEQSLELMYRKLHSDPTPLSQIAPQEIPPFLNELVANCMARSPEDRPENVHLILTILNSHDDTLSGMVCSTPKREEKKFGQLQARIALILSIVAPMIAYVAVAMRPSPIELSPHSIPKTHLIHTGSRIEKLQLAHKRLIDASSDESSRLPVTERLLALEKCKDLATEALKETGPVTGPDPFQLQGHLLLACIDQMEYSLDQQHDPRHFSDALAECQTALKFALKNGKISFLPAEAVYRKIADLYKQANNFSAAEKNYQRAYSINKTIEPSPEYWLYNELPGTHNSDILFCMQIEMAECKWKSEQLQAAKDLTGALQPQLKDPQTDFNSNTQRGIELLSWMHVMSKDWKAHTAFRRQIETAVREMGPEDPEYVAMNAVLAMIELEEAQLPAAVRLLNEAIDHLPHTQSSRQKVAASRIAATIEYLRTSCRVDQTRRDLDFAALKQKFEEARNHMLKLNPGRSL